MIKNKFCKYCLFLSLIKTVLIFPPIVFGNPLTQSWSANNTDAALEERIAIFLKRDRNQRRSLLTYNAILARIARQHAYDMGRRHYFDHKSPEGLGHVDRIKQAGYKPNRSGECITVGSETDIGAWNSWMDSPPHRSILLGLESNTFFASQVEYGIGHAYVPGSPWGHYWVAIIAAPEEPEDSSPSSDREAVTRELVDKVFAAIEKELAKERAVKQIPLVEKLLLILDSPYPNVIRREDKKLEPVSGYEWASDNPKDFRVRVRAGLTKVGDGFRPAKGYRWVKPDDSKNFRVEPIP